MINKSEAHNNNNMFDVPGNISILSKDNPAHGPSLIQDVWEF